MHDMWDYPDDVGGPRASGEENAWVGYGVEAIDGSIGTVDEATYEVGASYIVVDTGPWIFGKKVLLPAGLVQHVDAGEELVYVSRTKDQIKDAPELREDVGDPAYHDEISGYYGIGGPGFRDI